MRFFASYVIKQGRPQRDTEILTLYRAKRFFKGGESNAPITSLHNYGKYDPTNCFTPHGRMSGMKP